MKYMQCPNCKQCVEVNNTGICLQCQIHDAKPQKDVWHKNKNNISENINREKFVPYK